MIDRDTVIQGLTKQIDFAKKIGNRNITLYVNQAEDMLELLKDQEAVEPYMDYDGHDVWRCGNCGATIFHIEHSHADEDWKSYAKFCRQCGRRVKWE